MTNPKPTPTHPRPLGVEPEAVEPKAWRTAERWEVDGYVDDTGMHRISTEYDVIAYAVPRHAPHIVACVNALAGLRPEAVAELVEAAEPAACALDEQVGNCESDPCTEDMPCSFCCGQIRASDALREALRRVLTKENTQ